jgi:hypothetical protein
MTTAPPPSPTSSTPSSTARSAFSAVAAAVPHGSTLPEPVWRHRHRWIVNLLWLHLAFLPLYALYGGYGPAHALRVCR